MVGVAVTEVPTAAPVAHPPCAMRMTLAMGWLPRGDEHTRSRSFFFPSKRPNHLAGRTFLRSSVKPAGPAKGPMAGRGPLGGEEPIIANEVVGARTVAHSYR